MQEVVNAGVVHKCIGTLTSPGFQMIGKEAVCGLSELLSLTFVDPDRDCALLSFSVERLKKNLNLVYEIESSFFPFEVEWSGR